MKKIGLLLIVFCISTQTIAKNWTSKKLIEPNKNVDWVMYDIYYALEGEEVRNPEEVTGTIKEFSPVRRPTVLCVLHSNGFQISQSCVDIGEPVSIAQEVPDLLISDTINRIPTTSILKDDPQRLIEFTPYSSDKVSCQIIIPLGDISCY